LLDDTSDGIDWDEITATTQPDFEAGRFAFNSEDYPTEEAAMAAMDALVEMLIEEALREGFGTGTSAATFRSLSSRVRSVPSMARSSSADQATA